MTPPTDDRSHESILNDALARFFRERCNLPDAAAETLRDGKRPDIVVRLPEGPVVVETEFGSARTVEADALSRLDMDIGGQKVQNAFAVAVPERLRSTPQRHLYERIGTAKLRWQEWRIDGTSGPMLTGTALELGNAVARTTPPSSNLDEAVDRLDEGARRAGSRLYASPGTLGRVSKVFGVEPGDNATANMAALVIINAMVFQERLANSDTGFQSIGRAVMDGRLSRMALLQIWDHILEVDYYPIFSMARDIVRELTEVEAAEVLGECAETASALLEKGAVGRHDLAGRVFNRLIANRKLLAAFYTTIPASTLLAGLALSAERWQQVDWGDPERLGKLCVVDPACGTGTLLMAAYRQIVQNYAAVAPAGADDPLLHQALVERVITGADVVQAAIHLTAATLAAMSPSVRFEQMQLHTLRLGTGTQTNLQGEESRDVWLGSLDWLKATEVQSFFSATEEQVGATTGNGGVVQRPKADLVISNPPYVRRGSDGGKREAISRVFRVPEGDEESRQAIAKRTSELLRGTPANQNAGHGTSFAVLADRMVKAGGRVALVLPVTALSGERWRDVRQMLSDGYEVEYVVSSHDPALRSMSFDTGIAETLLVARRLEEDESPTGRGLFVNLWRAPYQETDALALVSAVRARASNPVLQFDGQPAGGSALMVGGEQWGEIVEGPAGNAPWSGARWRRALTGQFATALERGELWAEGGAQVAAEIPVAPLADVCNVGPQHRRIRGSLGVFDAHRGWDEQAQFPALWRHKESTHRSLISYPNAYLVPQPGRDHVPIWEQAGTLQITPDVQYDSQRVIATQTIVRALGVRAWHSLNVEARDHQDQSRREAALALWCNSTFGMLLHANHSNRAQRGRGTGNKGMLETLTTLDVRKLDAWQLDAADAIWRDFSAREFRSFHQCAVDPARIELDERVIRDMLGLEEDAVATVARLRTLLASEPSIHGSKQPELPT